MGLTERQVTGLMQVLMCADCYGVPWMVHLQDVIGDQDADAVIATLWDVCGRRAELAPVETPEPIEPIPDTLNAIGLQTIPAPELSPDEVIEANQ